MKVLVTGANGFVGRATCGALGQKGHSFSAVVRRPSGVAEEWVVGDVGSHTDWREALSAVDTVIHLAARVHLMNDVTEDPLSAFRNVNVAGTLNLAHQAVQAGVRRFAFISSIKVNGDERDAPYTEADTPTPQDAYGMSKWEAEQGLRQIESETGMEVVILRPPLVYGPRVGANFLELTKMAALGLPLPLGALNNQRSLIFVGNLVDAILRCVDHPAAAGKTFLVSDGQDVSTTDLVRQMASALGRPARLVALPAPILRAVASLAGKSALARRLTGSLMIDSSKIRRDLDWTPPFTLAEGLNRTMAWYLARP